MASGRQVDRCPAAGRHHHSLGKLNGDYIGARQGRCLVNASPQILPATCCAIRSASDYSARQLCVRKAQIDGGTVHMPCVLYCYFDKESRIFSASRSRGAKTLAERSQARTTRAPANWMGRRHGETIHHDAGHSSTILPPNPPASIRAWTSRAAARGKRSMTTG